MCLVSWAARKLKMILGEELDELDPATVERLVERVEAAVHIDVTAATIALGEPATVVRRQLAALGLLNVQFLIHTLLRGRVDVFETALAAIAPDAHVDAQSLETVLGRDGAAAADLLVRLYRIVAPARSSAVGTDRPWPHAPHGPGDEIPTDGVSERVAGEDGAARVATAPVIAAAEKEKRRVLGELDNEHDIWLIDLLEDLDESVEITPETDEGAPHPELIHVDFTAGRRGSRVG